MKTKNLIKRISGFVLAGSILFNGCSNHKDFVRVNGFSGENYNCSEYFEKPKVRDDVNKEVVYQGFWNAFMIGVSR